MQRRPDQRQCRWDQGRLMGSEATYARMVQHALQDTNCVYVAVQVTRNQVRCQESAITFIVREGDDASGRGPLFRGRRGLSEPDGR